MYSGRDGSHANKKKDGSKQTDPTCQGGGKSQCDKVNYAQRADEGGGGGNNERKPFIIISEGGRGNLPY